MQKVSFPLEGFFKGDISKTAIFVNDILDSGLLHHETRSSIEEKRTNHHGEKTAVFLPF
jgi:hypothetical protein